MPRNCNCAGGVCGPAGEQDGITRRDFIALTSIGAAGAMASDKSWAEWVAQQGDPTELAAWKAALHKPSPRRLYRSDTHTDARMHLGGIGTGNFELGADGQITTWQLFNTLRDGYVPLFFGIRTAKGAKMLQTRGGPEGLPHVAAIEMHGEYPIATLRFADSELPVQVELTAFSPFEPLNARLSSMPAACFVFKVHNRTAHPQEVGLAAFMQNPVGYDAMGVPISFNSVGFNSVTARLSNEHPNFGGNVNEPFTEGPASGLLLRAIPGKPPTLDKPLTIFTNLNTDSLNAKPLDRPADLTIEPLDKLTPHPSRLTPAVIWLEDAPAALAARTLRDIRDAVRNGATLIFSGQEQPLLRLYAEVSKGKPVDPNILRPDIMFEDFERGYDNWTVQGEAFGMRPAAGPVNGQNPVSGFTGHGLVNSYLGGDDTTGRMVSKPFSIERNYIRYLIGGGRSRDTQIRLVIDGKTVRATSGRDDEHLLPAFWDVREFRGKRAHIEIVDEAKGGWGHINVDQIEFSDLPGSVEAMLILDELLPARFSGIEQTDSLANGPIRFVGVTYKPGAAHDESGVWGVVGRSGLVTLRLGSILRPSDVELTGARQRAYEAVIRWSAFHLGGYKGPLSAPEESAGFGTLSLATTGPARAFFPAFTDWKAAWEAFANKGFVEKPAANAPTPTGSTVNGAVASSVTVGPGKTVEIPFFLTWRYPNKYNRDGVAIGNNYATLWPDARAVAKELAENFPEIRRRTERFVKTFYGSTLPYWLLDAITSQMSTIRHIGVLFRTAKGDTYGWEGSNGCCDPTCTHVWGYEQTLARLFPDLERDMRRIDYQHQQGPDGGINNRTYFPSPTHPTGERPFTDGHASCVLKAYREAMNHSEESWLSAHWPAIKKAVQYLIDRDAKTSGGNPNGLLEDDQWNTYDEALHGVTSFIGTYYLAALRAGEDLAHRVGDHEFGNRCRVIFLTGQENLINKCWNGEYFQQNLPGYEKMWGEVGPGCMADQLIGQWWAHQLGLGYLLPPEMVKTALRSVFKYNWMPDLTNWRHMPRAFAGAKDKGLIICTWPKGGRPANVMLYSDEVWTGIEYQVASHMIYEGMLEEGFSIAKGARDRYDEVPKPPIPRSPWNEIECGGHYARAMSSWSLLLAVSGFEIDGPAGHIRFTPRHAPDHFRSFFTGPECWGTLTQTRKGRTQRNEITVTKGRLKVARLHLDAGAKSLHVTIGGKAVPATLKPATTGVEIALRSPVHVLPGQSLVASLA